MGEMLTAGHSSIASEEFIGRLSRHSVDVVVDVRSSPTSRYVPQFNRGPLSVDLAEAGISYVFLGNRLGGRPSDTGSYRDGKVAYELLAQKASFQSAIDRLIRASERHTIAILCSEGDPLLCHRAILLAPILVSRGIDVQHLLADGSVETHDEAMNRLLLTLGEQPLSLFETRDALVASAVRRQAARIAYSTSDEGSEPLF